MDRGVWQTTVHEVTRVRQHLATKPPPLLLTSWGLPGGSVKYWPAVGDPGSIPESGRCPGEGNGYPLHLAWTVPWIEEYVFVE